MTSNQEPRPTAPTQPDGTNGDAARVDSAETYTEHYIVLPDGRHWPHDYRIEFAIGCPVDPADLEAQLADERALAYEREKEEARTALS